VDYEEQENLSGDCHRRIVGSVFDGMRRPPDKRNNYDHRSARTCGFRAERRIATDHYYMAKRSSAATNHNGARR
jgi:hypothetical protein